MKITKATTPSDLHERLWGEIFRTLRQGDGSAASEHLDAGFPIYYGEDDMPEGLLIKKYPDGHRELVRFDEAGDEVIRVL